MEESIPNSSRVRRRLFSMMIRIHTDIVRTVTAAPSSNHRKYGRTAHLELERLWNSAEG